MSTSEEITTVDKITLLKHLVNGKSPDEVGAIMKMQRFEVIDHAANHGYPHPDKMAKAVKLLQAKNTPAVVEDRMAPPAPPTRPAPAPQRQAARPTAPLRGAPRGLAAAPVPAGAAHPSRDVPSLAGPGDESRGPASLLAEGKASKKKRTQALAGRIQADLDKLEEILEVERAEEKEARRAAEAVEKLRKEKAQLEEKLAAVNAQLRGSSSRGPQTSSSKSASSGAPAKEIRAWARAEGLEVPDSGRVPQRICDAYAAAQAGRAGRGKVA